MCNLEFIHIWMLFGLILFIKMQDRFFTICYGTFYTQNKHGMSNTNLAMGEVVAMDLFDILGPVIYQTSTFFFIHFGRDEFFSTPGLHVNFFFFPSIHLIFLGQLYLRYLFKLFYSISRKLKFLTLNWPNRRLDTST